ncbi:mitochondrial inner membrane protease subunit 1-like [Brassica napus]|uniref:mitochondrial inner membrane protease subunit 1-like n=1 Tax=Brassica napus TaxID=3708 RepID=UPI0006AB502C|nr:mitochondrial inner membrane protease subunit 1-like [Brassica napus]XP_048625435.1 mitochondrial inner membrane protease subunit 1-like [Brassica napus]
MRWLRYLNQWRGTAKEAFDQVSIVAKFLCLLHVTDRYIISSTHVQGPSMLPTLNLTGDVILAEHVSHRFGKIGLGDVVLVRSPTDPMKMVTKRVLGLEGHRLSFFADPLVGDDSVNVVGDNVHASTDSRNFGPVPYDLIEGKALLRVWPLRCFGSLR